MEADARDDIQRRVVPKKQEQRPIPGKQSVPKRQKATKKGEKSGMKPGKLGKLGKFCKPSDCLAPTVCDPDTGECVRVFNGP